MGEAKRRGSYENRIQNAKNKKIESPRVTSLPSRTDFLAAAQLLDQHFKRLTTPAEIDENVKKFSAILSNKEPFFIDCQPELWSRQSCCDLNVKEYIKNHGGQALNGYRIWYAKPDYIEGERHAVWTDGSTIRDVSFVDTGEESVVFVPDDLPFDSAPPRIRFALNEDLKPHLDIIEKAERFMPMQKMPDKEAWDTFLTFESWSQGKRMPNFVLASK